MSLEYTSSTFRPLLNKLVQTPEYFTPDDLKLSLNHLFTPDTVLPAQIGAFLTALHIHRVERRPESLVAAAEVLRERALKAAVQNTEGDFVVDIVGTGGDGHNLFNVSTTAAVVAAGAGARVIKVRLSPLFLSVSEINQLYSHFLHKKKKKKLGTPQLHTARQQSLNLLLRLRRPPPIPLLPLHSPNARYTHAHRPRPLHIHPRTALPPLHGLHRALPQSPPLPHDVQRPRSPNQPRPSARDGVGCSGTRAGRDVRNVPKGRRCRARAGGVWVREA